MKSQLSESGLRISLRFLDQKLCSIEVQSGHCYSPLEGCIICTLYWFVGNAVAEHISMDFSKYIVLLGAIFFGEGDRS